jgi:phosphate transport system permease protein
MSTGWLVAIVIGIGAVAYLMAAQKARAIAAAADRSRGEVPHSLPAYHGWFAFICATLPALLLLLVWSIGTGIVVEQKITGAVTTQIADPAQASLSVGMVHNAADALEALGLSGTAVPTTYAALRDAATAKNFTMAEGGADYMVDLAASARADRNLFHILGQVLSVIASLGGAFWAFRQVKLRLRARNNVERVVLGALIAASTVAILTTIGIVLSMLGETVHFFSDVNPIEFFFGTVWDPRFAAAGSGGSEGQFGLIPLLAGTLYIAAVSMAFAVPVGLMSAIYMGEYASPKVRATVKPLLELLAGIPTIVYGIFALITLGPFLRDLSAALAGGTPFIQAQSVLTAGLVMGVMLIPVVSSLSDDVITAVPRAMRDGSLALGSTRSETIRRVILPAALPGIVGALLLTASRAIGETMIVVLAAGVAARLTINPFEAMTTITVKIVNQLTGDLEFNSPQTLVAFALGLTLFVVTLGMNIYALYIVRKYREQYE